ncbi:hypothetical protein HK097_000333 [Rhizophlyctis rosea]|uniref:Uncharacterized protein n=1 Tax=Rhizophlyctis rosea TaxID=64517 RepID=A0AAD5WYX5_9FUNG|nr:hypothetical protein HK097_000333 [Rhizophlyctis rosea]
MVANRPVQVQRGDVAVAEEYHSNALSTMPHIRYIINDPFGVFVSKNLPSVHQSPPSARTKSTLEHSYYFGFNTEEQLGAYLQSISNIDELELQLVQGAIDGISNVKANRTFRTFLADRAASVEFDAYGHPVDSFDDGYASPTNPTQKADLDGGNASETSLKRNIGSMDADAEVGPDKRPRL